MKYVLSIFALLITNVFVSNAGCIYEKNLEGENLQVGTMLKWSTAMEEETAIFVVEKSEDGTNFTSIGSIEALGNSTDLHDYNFLDILASAEQTFYRLKQVDTDGSSSLSEVIAVPQVFENNFQVVSMSNVATQDKFEASIDSSIDGDMSVELLNLRGDKVFGDEAVILAGLNDISIDLTSHEEGIYRLVMTMNNEEEVLVIKKVTDEIAKRPNVASSKRFNKGRN